MNTKTFIPILITAIAFILPGCTASNNDSKAFTKTEKLLQTELKKNNNYVTVGGRSIMNIEEKATINQHQKRYPDVQIIRKGSFLKI